jgi:hypothetical protein
MAGATVTSAESGVDWLALGLESPLMIYPSLDAMLANVTQAAMDATAADPDDMAQIAIPISEHARKLLRAVLIEIESLPAFGHDLPNGRTLELRAIRDKGIPYRPSTWNGAPLNDTERQAYSRAALQLQMYGLLERITEQHRDRVTHVRLTDKGLRLALRLAGRDIDRSAHIEGLRLTNWGRELVKELRVEWHQKKVDVSIQQNELTTYQNNYPC